MKKIVLFSTLIFVFQFAFAQFEANYDESKIPDFNVA